MGPSANSYAGHKRALSWGSSSCGHSMSLAYSGQAHSADDVIDILRMRGKRAWHFCCSCPLRGASCVAGLAEAPSPARRIPRAGFCLEGGSLFSLTRNAPNLGLSGVPRSQPNLQQRPKVSDLLLNVPVSRCVSRRFKPPRGSKRGVEPNLSDTACLVGYSWFICFPASN